MNIIPITKNLHDKLQIFCDECNKLGYKNNASFEAMRLDWCKDWGEFFCIVVDNKIISVSGCHPLPEVDNTAWRIFFRSCVLPKSLPFKGLHKQINPKTRLYCRKFIDYLPTKNLYITTNVENNEYSEIFRYHKPVLIESEQESPLVENAGQIRLYDTEQIIWKFNVDLFNKIYQ